VLPLLHEVLLFQAVPTFLKYNVGIFNVFYI
jgi:hypothetical protein